MADTADTASAELLILVAEQGRCILRKKEKQSVLRFMPIKPIGHQKRSREEERNVVERPRRCTGTRSAAVRHIYFKILLQKEKEFMESF